MMAGQVVSVGPAKDPNTSVGLTKNLSATGLLFKDSRKYEIGDLVVVSINQGAVKELDENLADVIKTREFAIGRIVRAEELKSGEDFEYGVCFVRNDGEVLDYFDVFVKLINHVEFQEALGIDLADMRVQTTGFSFPGRDTSPVTGTL